MGIILLYHRIARIDTDPQRLCVSPENFQQQLEVLLNTYTVLPLSDIENVVHSVSLKRRFVVITFDDGYADNFYQAKPLLQQYGCPATVFVSSGMIEQTQGFWGDQLKRSLLTPGTLPKTFSLHLHGTSYIWNLGDYTHYTHSEYQRYRHWHVLLSENPTPRHRMYRELHRLLRSCSPEKRQELIENLCDWAGMDSTLSASDRVLTRRETRQIKEEGLIEIGAHCVNHPQLSSLTVSQQHHEISQSKISLEAIVGQPVTSFAYPYGTHADYTSETVTLVQKAGFSRACSNFSGLVRWYSDEFQLPRFLVRNWTKEEFKVRLQRWFNQ